MEQWGFVDLASITLTAGKYVIGFFVEATAGDFAKANIGYKLQLTNSSNNDIGVTCTTTGNVHYFLTMSASNALYLSADTYKLRYVGGTVISNGKVNCHIYAMKINQ